MKIIQLRAENFKKLKVVEIRPDGNMVQITGRNGQGKTSLIECIYFAFRGAKALPLKPVRKGTERLLVKLATEEFTITRTLAEGSSVPTLKLEMKGDNKRDATPEAFLKKIFGALTFDPLAFVNMSTLEKVEELRRTANIDLDFVAIDKANADDFTERSKINKEVKELTVVIDSMTVLEGLPAKRIDEEKILAQLNAAGEANAKAQEIFVAKQNLGAEAARMGVRRIDSERGIGEIEAKIKLLEEQLAKARVELKDARQAHKEAERNFEAAEKAFRDAPAGDPIDVAALTAELQSAQRTNKAIEQREIYDTLRAKRDKKQTEADMLTSRREARDEKKRQALANAKLPVVGLTFDETNVLYKGIPIENLGEGEQIRISAQIGMAANPKLRVMCIHHGEALDEEGLKILAELAEKNDFQIWMARVDSSGTVGIVLEDGMVAGSNAAEEAE